MNEAQKAWTVKKCETLLEASSNIYDMTEQDWEIVFEMINKYVTQAKGNDSVKKALIATETYIEQMYKILRDEQ